MPTHQEINRLRQKVSGDEEIETTFQRLRNDGHTRLEAVRIILDVLDVSLSEAKTLLLTHDTWDDARTAVDQSAPSDDPPDDPVPPAPA